MSSFPWREKVLAGSILAGLMGSVPVASAVAQQKTAPPDFSSNYTGWVGLNGGGPFSIQPLVHGGPLLRSCGQLSVLTFKICSM